MAKRRVQLEELEKKVLAGCPMKHEFYISLNQRKIKCEECGKVYSKRDLSYPLYPIRDVFD